MPNEEIDVVSVIVPQDPFPPARPKVPQSRCLCALDIESQLMKWWPGTPHEPKKRPEHVRAIQRSLDWKRVAQIAAYLLQEDIETPGERIEKYFGPIYEPHKNDPGREWPPQLPKMISHQHSEYPEFSDILIHVNGGELKPIKGVPNARHLIVDPRDKAFRFTVIDGQHRINGAYLALKILQERKGQGKVKAELSATVYLNLDPADGPPRHQAQLFIDVNFNQKKVDRSLVFDLFPTARGREPLDNQERSQDIARQLMLEIGPLVGMVQIPGIKYGVKGVVTLATLAGAVQNVLPYLDAFDLRELKAQSEFVAQFLNSWLNATGWKVEKPGSETEVDPESVVYQGRVLVSAVSLIPAALLALKKRKTLGVSEAAGNFLTEWAKGVLERADLIEGGRFVTRKDFRREGFLGSGGIGRFRNRLWAAMEPGFKKGKLDDDAIEDIAEKARAKVNREAPALNGD